MLSHQDLQSIQQHGLTTETVESQIERFKTGFPSIEIVRAATLANGILGLSNEEIENYVQVYDSAEVEVLKFVPASGAATRMFKKLFGFMSVPPDRNHILEALKEDEDLDTFFSELKSFAFFEVLNKEMIAAHEISVDDALAEFKHHMVLSCLLESEGLNYGNLPKGLISFHKYENNAKTPSVEHISECIDYAQKYGKAHLHFTVSPSHRKKFEQHISESLEANGLGVEVSYSEQFPSTDTVAVTPSFDFFRPQDNALLFRPAGHGALLSNLNELDFDVIFIKNIDNVVPDSLREEEIKYKKALGGVLLSYQSRVFKLLSESEAGNSIGEKGKQLLRELGMTGEFSEKEVLELLNRPLRVCGMVRNEGDPGGGPFWVKGDKSESLQIIESAQVNNSDENQEMIFRSGTHFNPVDIVCGVKNYQGEKFDLMKYRDENTGFISEKSHEGRKLLAMELPGLWNGSMANWNTVFVEVPVSTFNPVKTVNDLLRPRHR